MHRNFQQLTFRGQVRRLRAVAVAVLQDYSLHLHRLRFRALETNLLFQVQDVDGCRYALRIGIAGRYGAEDHELETRWLVALRRDTDLLVAEPVARIDGGYVTQAVLPEIPRPLECVLFRWIPGCPLAESLSPHAYTELGRAMARLHEHAASFPVPEDRRPHRWDRVFYRPDEPVAFFHDEHRQLFSTADLRLLSEVTRRADDHLHKIREAGQLPRLLHGDLHMGNVHMHRGALYLLDFEDLKWGYPVQDLAVTLFYGRDRADYGHLRQALRRGYESLLPWPAHDSDELELLMAARSLRLLNYVLRRQPDPREYAQRVLQRLRDFTGSGRRHPRQPARAPRSSGIPEA